LAAILTFAMPSVARQATSWRKLSASGFDLCTYLLSWLATPSSAVQHHFPLELGNTAQDGQHEFAGRVCVSMPRLRIANPQLVLQRLNNCHEISN